MSAQEEMGLAAEMKGEERAEKARPELTPRTEVPIQVTVRLGAAEMTLKELLALTPGAIVTLERKVGEPVELLVGDRVIAIGELVRVEEELGVRILEVAAG